MCVFYVLKEFQVVSTITVRDIYIAVVSVVYYKKCECDHGVDKSWNLTLPRQYGHPVNTAKLFYDPWLP